MVTEIEGKTTGMWVNEAKKLKKSLTEIIGDVEQSLIPLSTDQWLVTREGYNRIMKHKQSL